MAEYTPTAANVIASNVVPQYLTAGEAITAGQLIYRKASDSKAYLAQSDGTEEEAGVIGMALNAAAAGQPVQYAAGGASVEITLQAGIFTTPGTGQILVLGPTAGKFSDASDLDAATDDYVVIVGWATDTNKMRLYIYNTATTRPGA